MEFKTLEQTGIDALADAFNLAFADYAIPFQLDTVALHQKFLVEDVDLRRSVGAFDGSKLVGFTVFGIGMVHGTRCAWDGGTGVIPAYRGQKLTQRMFDFILPRLQQDGIRRTLLEVLESNTIAHRLYQQLGFCQTRKLAAYKGVISPSLPESHAVEVLTEPDLDALLQLGDWEPAWQQMNQRVRNWGDQIQTFGIRKNGALTAYVHYHPARNRVLQFATAKDHRRQGLASALLHRIASDNEVWIVNVDESATDVAGFLQVAGLKPFIGQYEMERVL